MVGHAPCRLGNNRKKRTILLCANPICNNKFERKQAELSIKNFCSCSCSAQVNNIKRLKKIRNCHNPLCKNEFVGRNKYCSLHCIPNKQSKYTKQIIIETLKEFEHRNGRIPTKQDLMKIYTPIRRFWGTWNKAIEAAGFTPNPVMFAKKHVSKDGHICDSLAEMIIDNWLFQNNIEHLRRVAYPDNTKLTTDFVIDDYWIEFFGLQGQHKRYDQLREEKLRIVKINKLQLIELFPQDLFPKNKLSDKLFMFVTKR